jgi:serine/threonine protein kinase
MNDASSPTEALFLAAAEIVEPQERTAFLTRECGGDRALRERVEGLLASHEGAGDFLEASAPSTEMEAEFARLKPEEAGERIGPYKLREQIGEGGFGVVWVAEQQEPVRRTVAMKIIKLGMDTREVVARFEQERQALAMMDHPNIARVLDAGATEHGRPFFVMELVRGIKITDYCDQTNLPTEERLALFITVCHAVQHAHQKGIIHRDLKPSNILVTLHDGVPVPKVIDFGVAKATQGQLGDFSIYTQFQQMIGTPLYMSPEQAEMSGLDVDTRTDIYALGVLLYELLTGRTPFDANAFMKAGHDEMRRIIREQEPARPSTALHTMAQEKLTSVALHRASEPPKLIHAIHGDLDWIVMKTLEKDRARRYDTANGLAADIRRHLDNEPVVARPPSRFYRLQKLVRRNKLSFAAGTAVVIALVAGIIVSSWQATRARRAEQAAKDERDSVEAVLKFFRDKILAGGRPEGQEGGLGKDVTLRRAIDAAEPQIAASFQNRPLVEGGIRAALGKSYYYLGEFHLAVEQHERALALRKHHLGTGHSDTLESMNDLAMAYWAAGQHGRAVQLFEETFKCRSNQLGPDHPDTLLTMNNLVGAYLFGGHAQKAVPLAQTALALQKTKLGPDHLQTVAATLNLAKVYCWFGKADQSLPLIEETVRIRTAKLGPDHPDTIVAIEDFGYALARAGKFEQAIQTYQQTLKLRTAKLGSTHPDTLFTMVHLALAYQQAGKLEDAIPLFEETFKGRKNILGPGHYDTRDSLKELARAYQAANKMDKAEALLLEGYEQLQRESTDEKYTRDVLQRLVLLYEGWNKPEKRAEWLQKLEAFDQVRNTSSGSDASNQHSAEAKAETK